MNSVTPITRDAEATRTGILSAAKKEFAENGLGGARVDVIAERAQVNKRMIYHYFGNKEGLFRTVLIGVYVGIRTAEQELELDDLPPRDALEKLVRFTWQYSLGNMTKRKQESEQPVLDKMDTPLHLQPQLAGRKTVFENRRILKV